MFCKIYIWNNKSVKIKQKSVNKKDENLKFLNNLSKQSFKSLILKYYMILMQLNNFLKI